MRCVFLAVVVPQRRVFFASSATHGNVTYLYASH